jgi:hypothetical protein
LDFLLTPEQIHLKTKSTVFVDLWAGSYNTVALTDKVTKGLKKYKIKNEMFVRSSDRDTNLVNSGFGPFLDPDPT